MSFDFNTCFNITDCYLQIRKLVSMLSHYWRSCSVYKEIKRLTLVVGDLGELRVEE